MITIAITGAAGYIGQRLVALLAAEPGVDRILALDVRPLPPLSPKVTRLTGFQYPYDGRATFEDFLRGRIGQASLEQDRAADRVSPT